MSGASLTTHGLVSGGGGSEEQTIGPPPPEPLSQDAGTPTKSVMIIVPTAPNVCLMAAQNITQNLLVRQAANLTLPSLYKRAYFIAYETDEVAVVK